jgi:hypothetical protein
MLFRKGAMKAERIMNTTKSSTSIMFATTAAGGQLPVYVVYKRERMQDNWVRNGLAEARYNVSKSGWFDSDLIVLWIKSVVIPYTKILPNDIPRVLIGDNLPSHISHEALCLCLENNIRMTFLPSNATHLLQPLDVGIFGSLKAA